MISCNHGSHGEIINDHDKFGSLSPSPLLIGAHLPEMANRRDTSPLLTPIHFVGLLRPWIEGPWEFIDFYYNPRSDVGSKSCICQRELILRAGYAYAMIVTTDIHNQMDGRQMRTDRGFQYGRCEISGSYTILI